MKESEFYRRAACDPDFRRQTLDDLRYFKKVGIGLMCFCGGLALVISLYGGVTHGEWGLGSEMLFVTALTGFTCTMIRRRVSSLEALDHSRPNREKTG